MKISFITTVYNEEKTIDVFLKSLLNQSTLPDEIIIVDGDSKDATVAAIKKFQQQFTKQKIAFKILIKKGNRAVGRNEAIKNAKEEIIVCSDSGNILDRNWMKNITISFKDKSVDVVAGYYKGKAFTVFQKCVIPYVLVMPDKVNPQSFLPATRSIAFTKSIWKKAGGFNEKYSHNEDYVFAKKLQQLNATIIFAKEAVVYWLPRKTFKEAFIMFFRFALGDAEAKIVRPKVILLFIRYFLFALLLICGIILKLNSVFSILEVLLILYILWAIVKNYRYVKDYRAIIVLPLLQLTADAAVISGTLVGAPFLFKWVVTFLFLSLMVFLPFRYLRNMFPNPQIKEDGIVGYSQYFGYPFYFDTILFFIFILLPLASYFIYYKKFKK